MLLAIATSFKSTQSPKEAKLVRIPQHSSVGPELLFCSPYFLGSGLSNRQNLTLVKQCLVLFCSAVSELGKLAKWFRRVAAVPDWNEAA